MQILLIHQAFVSPREAGGTRHHELATYLKQRGHLFTIVASNLNHLSGKSTTAEQGLVTTEEIDGIRILRAYTYPSLHRSLIWRVVTFLSFMCTSVIAGLKAGPVDVVMGTSPPIFQAVSAWLIAALRRRPFLLEVRDLWPEFAVDMGVLTNPILIGLSRSLERFLYARATHIVVNSPAYRTYLIEKGVAPAKVSLITNGVDTAMFDPEADGRGIREQYKLKDKFVVVYAGALGMANDINTILAAAKRLREQDDIHFLLVGDGKERSNLEQIAADLNLTNVTFSGSVPKVEVPRYLAAADVCTATLQNIPMFKTTYPNKVFDYMAAGRPIVLGIDGVIRDVVERADAGVFAQPGDADALAEAICQLYRQPERRLEMGRNGRRYVEEHFERQQQAEELLTLIERLN